MIIGEFEFETIQQKIGLHTRLEVIYIVDGYEAKILNEQDQTLYEGTGRDLNTTLTNLVDKIL